MSSLVGGDSATRESYDAFIDLVCRDEDLLRAEFDELIAESWATTSEPAPPPSPPPPAPSRPTPPPRRPVRAIEDEPTAPAQVPVPAPRWNRQRSPPNRDATKGR
jgi:hypothetical protein